MLRCAQNFNDPNKILSVRMYAGGYAAGAVMVIEAEAVTVFGTFRTESHHLPLKSDSSGFVLKMS